MGQGFPVVPVGRRFVPGATAGRVHFSAFRGRQQPHFGPLSKAFAGLGAPVVSPLTLFRSLARAGFVLPGYSVPGMTWPALSSPDEYGFRAARADLRLMNLTPVQSVRTAPAAASDEALVIAGRGGDAAALDVLFSRFANMVHGLAFRLLGSDSEVDDIVQDAFVEALTHLHRLEEPAAFRGWLKSIVVRTTCKRLRRRRLLTRLGLRRTEPVDVDSLPISSAAPPEAAAELRRIFSLINSLPVQERVALLLHRVEGMTLPEVAEQMQLSLTTVKRRIAAAEQVVGRRDSVEVNHV